MKIELLDQLLFFNVFCHLLYPKLFWQNLLSLQLSTQCLEYFSMKMNDDLLNDVVLWVLSTSVNQMSQTQCQTGHYNEKYLLQDHNYWWVSVAEAGTRNNSVAARGGLISTFFFLLQCVIFAAHLTPTESGFCSVFPCSAVFHPKIIINGFE